MPDFNKPAGAWLGNRQARGLNDVESLKKQGTEYIVNAQQECVAILGNIEHYPLPPGPGVQPEAKTGLTGWGIAVLKKGVWVSLNA
jgi:hypothetical protein